jgi:nucleotide-binding universal stress UspA family protein
MTTTFRHVLVPTDFGDAARHARELAITIAQKFDAKITLFHAYYAPPMPLGNPFQWPMGEVARIAREELEKQAEEVRRVHAKVATLVQDGSPADAILAAVEQTGADLIVMGTHGRRGGARFLLGSVAANVVRLATVPVLTVAERASS